MIENMCNIIQTEKMGKALSSENEELSLLIYHLLPTHYL